ncbi:MAG: general secretion pathway protein GspB [Desulfobacterales bacterium]
MSTILKALKRIDQTTPSPDDPQAWPPKIDTKKTVKTRVHKIWLYRRVYLTLILIVILIAAGWLAYSQKHWLTAKIFPQKTSAKGPVYQAKINSGSDKSKGVVPEKDPALKRQNVRPDAGSGPRPAGVDRQPRKLPRTPVSPKSQKSKILPSSRKIQPQEIKSTAKSNTTRSPKAISEKPVESKTRPAAAAPAKKSSSRVARSYRRLDDSKLDLQAIAWSKDASQRLAVINGHIVREGESVEGFLVNQIRQDTVIVNDGTSSWQIEFGLK